MARKPAAGRLLPVRRNAGSTGHWGLRAGEAEQLGAPALDCGKYSNAPGVCNDRIQFFEYTGGVTKGKPQWTKMAGWLQPPTG